MNAKFKAQHSNRNDHDGRCYCNFASFEYISMSATFSKCFKDCSFFCLLSVRSLGHTALTHAFAFTRMHACNKSTSNYSTPANRFGLGHKVDDIKCTKTLIDHKVRIILDKSMWLVSSFRAEGKLNICTNVHNVNIDQFISHHWFYFPPQVKSILAVWVMNKKKHQ